MATWKWVIWDLAGAALGQVENADECKLSPRLNKMWTTSFRLPLNNPMTDQITSRDGDVLCGVYRDSTLLFIGELVTYEEVGPGYRIVVDRDTMLNRVYGLPAADAVMSEDTTAQAAHGLFEGAVSSDYTNVLFRKAFTDASVSLRANPKRTVTIEPITDQTSPSLACNFGDALWRLSKRLVAKATSPITYGDPTPITRGDLIEQLVTEANAERDTGVRIGTIDTGYNVTPGEWNYKPLSEAITDLVDTPTIPFETPSVYVQRDNFNAQSNGALTGKTPQDGNINWTHFTGISASTRQWSVFSNTGVSGGPGIVRGPFSPVDGSSWNLGHWIYCDSTNRTNSLGEVFYKVDNIYTASPPGADISVGRFARLDAANGAVMAVVKWDLPTPYLLVFLMVWNGSAWIADPTSIQTQSMPWWIPDTYFALRLGVDDSGGIVVWNYDPASTPGGGPPNITMQRSECVTGGLLETGLSGIYTRHNSTVGTIAADETWAATPALEFVAQGVDFELVPSVPTADTNQSGVVGAGLKIATLNCPIRLGSLKTNVLFGRGGGATHVPAFSDEYIIGDDCPVHLEANGSDRLSNVSVRVKGVEITRDKQNKVTEVPVLEDQ